MTVPGITTKSVQSVLADAYQRTSDPGIEGQLWNDNGFVRFSLGLEPPSSWDDNDTWNDSLTWND